MVFDAQGVGSAPGEPVLQARSVCKRFGGIRALNKCDISVGRGEVVALVGPNGSGKTTLMSILLGLQRPDEGSVRFAGNDVTALPPKHRHRCRIAAAYQTPQLVDSLSAIENVEFGSRLKRFPGGKQGLRERIAEVLAELKLDKVANQPVYSLSGGQRKLVELARAVVVEPEVLLLDEPTAGVAPSLEGLIRDRVLEATAAGAGVLVVSHNLPWVFSLCQRVVVLAAGEVLADGSAEDVQQDSSVLAAYLH
jgi:ABC-type branched-subunit amino acid transport system ATPase component